MTEHFLAPPVGDFSGGHRPDSNQVRSFRNTLYEYYGAHGRAFPWRETKDPYEILVSELMLQQTQTARALPKYLQFLERWPTVEALAQAGLAEVYELWRGLGYNRRAKALLDAAGVIVSKHRGTVPASVDDLVELPMIGRATASAICAFAFDMPVVFLETNIRRVYLHFFFDGGRDITDRELLAIGEVLLDTEDPRNWYYALMDYGVFLKGVVPNPNRRSRHYHIQAPFEGSNRQLRGGILRTLSARGRASPEELAEDLSFAGDRVAYCLEQLHSEGLVEEVGGLYRIPE